MILCCDNMIADHKKHFSLVLIVLLLFMQLVPLVFYWNAVDHRAPILGVSLWNWLYSNITLGCSATAALVCAFICHKRGNDLLPKPRTLILLLVLAVAWCLAFNPDRFKHLAQLPLSLLFFISFWALGKAIFGKLSYLIWFFSLFILMAVYAAVFQNMVLSAENIMELLGCSWQDAKSYFTPGTVALLFLAVFIAVAAYHPVYLSMRKESRWTMAFQGFLCSTLLLVSLRPLETRLQTGPFYMWPLGRLETLSFDTARAVAFIYRTKVMTANLPPQGTTGATCTTVQQGSGVICLLHVGESLRADHLSVNGWYRDTTPWLKKQENLINFRDCVASGPSTDKAVMGILTNARRDFLDTNDSRYLPSSAGLMDFFAETGFRCASFWGSGILNGVGVCLFNEEARFFIRESNDNFETPGKAWNQVPTILNYIGQHEGENLFLLLNNGGSHAYFHEYDTENPPFTPVRPPTPDDRPQDSAQDAEIFVNAYDCTVHYTDEYIRRLLEPLKGKPYLYIYVSDHGEYVGQEGYWTRGNAPHSAFYKTAACQVPFLMIASPEFEALHPHFAEALAEVRRHQNMSVAHEHLFHTVLGIMGITTPYYDGNLDLSTPQVKPYTGPHPSRNGREAEE